jgi:outer membrane receptor protein involved in Fe transport
LDSALTQPGFWTALRLGLAVVASAGVARAGPPDPAAARGAPMVGEVVVVARTPLSVPGADSADVPASVAGLTAADIARLGSRNLAEVLLQRIPSVSINSQTGNDFEPDVQFRGFVATPVSGVPEGLAVYQNGVRINEAFGDNVRWDFIPTVAIGQLQVITDNPVFGLNALGGAIELRMQDGFGFHGLQTDLSGGSFGRVEGSAQLGGGSGGAAAYLAVEAAHDDGWRASSHSTIRRLYADVAHKGDRVELHLNVTAADNDFGAAAAAPIQLVRHDPGAVFTTPQSDRNAMAMASLQGRYRLSDRLSLDGQLYVRRLVQHHVDGNATDARACDAEAALLCFGDGSTPANGLDGRQLANPFGAGEILGEIDTNSARTTGYGGAVQLTSTAGLAGLANSFTAGASLDQARTDFRADAELGTIAPNFVVDGGGIFLGASGDPISDGPVRLAARDTYVGAYVLDTLKPASGLAVTAGGRFNWADVDLEDRLGGGLSGHHRYQRFNPVLGATYALGPGLLAYAGYSEANRAPTPLELGCANPMQPCIIDSFLVSDPELKQVVAHTFEAGLRGSLPIAGRAGALRWQLGLYRTLSDHDILDIPSPLNNGFGYFANVGGARRQGLDASLEVEAGRWRVYASYSYVDATYRSAIVLAAPGGDPFADAGGDIAVVPGDHISSVPRQRAKLGLDYDVTPGWTLGGDLLYIGAEYYGGDESNQNPQLPGYVTVGLHTTYRVSSRLEIYGKIENLLDRRYATFGTFFDNASYVGNPAFPDLSDPRTLTPGKPFAAYVGVKLSY